MLSRAGYLADLVECQECDDPVCVRGKADARILAKLRSDPRFVFMGFSIYHKDVGENAVEFRSHRKAFGKDVKGSLQFVVDLDTFDCYADVDRHPATSDLVGFFGHFFGEVVPGWFRRKRPHGSADRVL